MATSPSSFLTAVPVIKEACNKVVLNPSEESLSNLCSVIKATDSSLVNALDSIILFPINFHLAQKKSEETTCLLLTHLLELLKILEVQTIDAFLMLYHPLISQIKDIFDVGTTSEELKLSVLACLKQLIHSSSQDVAKIFFTRKYYSKLSASVFICTSIAKNEKYLTLKVKALKCLILLTQVESKLLLTNKEYKAQIVNILVLMLPGLMSTCLEIINKGVTQHHKVIVLALRLWSQVLSVVAEEPPYEDEESSSDYNFPGDRRVFLKKFMYFKRDKYWLKNSDEHLQTVNALIVKIQQHQHWKVRHELALGSYLILKHCGKNLPSSVGYLVEVLILLSQDNHVSIANKSKGYISLLRSKCEGINEKSFVEIVEENFFLLLSGLPRILYNRLELTFKENSLTLLCGFLEILGYKHLSAILSSEQHYKRFLYCLLMCSTPDCDRVQLVEELATEDVAMPVYCYDLKWRRLKYCQSDRCNSLFKRLCANVAQFYDKELLLNSLLDEFNLDNTKRKQITLLLLNLISSGSARDFYPYKHLVMDLERALTEPSLWDLPIYFVNEEVSISKLTVRENIIQNATADEDLEGCFVALMIRFLHGLHKVCLMADCVATLATVVSPEQFSPMLLECLYRVLECAGSPVNMISSAGRYALYTFTGVFNQKIPELITENIDYLTYHISLKLRHIGRYSRVSSVMDVIMDYTTPEMLPYVNNIIKHVLLESSDNSVPFLKVFDRYLICVEKSMFNKNDYKESSTNEALWLTELRQFNNNLNIANDFSEKDISEADIGELMRQQKETEEQEGIKPLSKPPIPEQITLTIQIMDRCLHALPGAVNLLSQTIVLQILSKGVDILSDWKEELLPVVHRMWEPLVQRIRWDTQEVILQKLFHFFIRLATHSKDFIRARTVKDVLPFMISVLNESSHYSEDKSSTGAYSMTQKYRLQLLLLSSISEIVIALEISPKDFYPLLMSTTVYLSSRQPTKFQEAVINMYKDLNMMYSEILWVYLMSVYSYQQKIKSHIAGLPDYKISGIYKNYDESDQYMNIPLILSFLNE